MVQALRGEHVFLLRGELVKPVGEEAGRRGVDLEVS